MRNFFGKTAFASILTAFAVTMAVFSMPFTSLAVEGTLPVVPDAPAVFGTIPPVVLPETAVAAPMAPADTGTDTGATVPAVIPGTAVDPLTGLPVTLPDAFTGQDMTQVQSDTWDGYDDPASLRDRYEREKAEVHGASEWLSDWEFYYLENEGRVILTRYTGRDREIMIPGKAEVNAEPCDVCIERLEENVFPTVASSVSFGVDGNKVYAGRSLESLFYFCPLLEKVDLKGLDTSAVTDMSGMFSGCRSLKYLDLTSLSTSAVTATDHMFRNCSSLITLDLGKTDFSNVQSMRGMFSGCEELKVLNMPALMNFHTLTECAVFPVAMYCNFIEFPKGEAITAMLQGMRFSSVPVFSFVESLTLDHPALMVDRGTEMEFTADIYPEDASIRDVIWSSDAPSVVSVDGNGRIKAHEKGSAYITARTVDGSGVMANCMVIVNPMASRIKLDQTELALGIGQSAALSAEVLPEDCEDRDVVWSVVGSAASVSKTGVVTGEKAGSAVVTASSTDGRVKAECRVSVSYAPVAVSIRLNEEEFTINRGEAFHLEADVRPYEADQTVIWSTSDDSVVSVSRSGIITGLLEGRAVITAETGDGRLKKECAVTVTEKPETASENHAAHMVIRSRDVEVTSITVSVNSYVPLYAELSSPNPGEITDTVYFNSLNDNVLCLKNLSADGLTGFFEAVSPGFSRVSIVCGHLRKTVLVTVTDDKGSLSFDGIEGDEIFMEPGEIRRLNVTPSGSARSEEVRWLVKSRRRGVINLNNGLVTARNREGTAIVTAYTDGLGISGGVSVKVTVRDSRPSFKNTSKRCSLKAPRNITIKAGDGEAAGSSRDITVRPVGRGFTGATVSMKISDESVCSVECTDYSKNRFTVTARKPGISYITWAAGRNINGVDTYAFYVTKVIVNKPLTSLDVTGPDGERSVSLKVGEGVKLKLITTSGYTEDRLISWVVKGRGVKVSDSGYLTAERKTDGDALVYVKSGNIVSEPLRVTVSGGEQYMVFRDPSVKVRPKDAGTTKMIRLDKGSGINNVTWHLMGAENTGISIEKLSNSKAKLIVPAGAEKGRYRILASSPGTATAECELLIEP